VDKLHFKRWSSCFIKNLSTGEKKFKDKTALLHALHEERLVKPFISGIMQGFLDAFSDFK
jgi:hypothetical protein